MSEEGYKVLIKGLLRVELLIKVNMEERYGEEATNKVCNEILEYVDKTVDKIYKEAGNERERSDS